MKYTFTLLAFFLLAATQNLNAQRITVTIAGNGLSGHDGDNGAAKDARIAAPQFICTDGTGNVYFVDANTIRRVSKKGIITTVAGGGSSTADGIPATNALLSASSICADAMGHLYVVTGNKIKRVDLTSGIITTYAGTGTMGYAGDGGAAVSAQFRGVCGICVDFAGNVYVADRNNNRIRKIDFWTGTITTVAGNGISGYTGDGGSAVAANLNQPNYICMSPLGDVYFTDQDGNWLRYISVSTGTINTYAGGGGGITNCHRMHTTLEVSGMCFEHSNNVCWNETSCSCRRIDHLTDTVKYIGGDYSTESFKDDTNSLYAWMNTNCGLAGDDEENLYVADKGNNRIRKMIKLTTRPRFEYGTEYTISACAGAVNSLDKALAITDLDMGQTETWSAITMPANGVLSGFPATAVSCSVLHSLFPAGLNYTPATGYSGTDSFKVRVTDGVLSDTLTLYLKVGAPNTGVVGGATSVCHGATANLTETVPGAWSSTNTSIATVTATGLVRGVSPGTVTMVYTTTTACAASVSTNITVNPLPASATITGNDTICKSATAMYTGSVAGGTWSISGSFSVATINSVSGVATGVNIGTTTISYKISNAWCSVTSTKDIAVTAPVAPISGGSTVCIGGTLSLAESIPGGTWTVTTGNAMIATVMSTGAVIQGLTTGTDIVTYTNTTVCGTASTTKSIVVDPPANAGTITGPSSACGGASVPFTTTGSGGSWSVSNSGDFMAGGNLYTNLGGITDTVYYIVNNGCHTDTASTTIFITPSPGDQPIEGASFVCLGGTTTLSDMIPGGTWSASNTNATVVGSGTSAVVTGYTLGTVTISYASTNVCGTGTVTKTITVKPMVTSSGTISGPATVCAGATVNFTASISGGDWSATNPAATIASITASIGRATGISPGIDTIVYTAACALNSATAAITVVPLPAVGPISGNDTVCAGSTTTYTNTVPGGTWSRTGAGIATINAVTGFTTGQSYGNTTIKYTTIASGCSSVATKAVTVFAAAAPITGAGTVCLGAVIALADPVPGGTWTASNTNASVMATSPSTADITGQATGNVTITYTNTNMCGTSSVTKVVAVDPPAVPGTITGPASICIGASAHYSASASGGSWSLSNESIANIGPAGTLTATIPGMDTIIYVVSSGCHTASATTVITINMSPNAGTVVGASNICIGATSVFSDAAFGGAWSITGGGATISAGGMVTAVSAGVNTVKYTVTNACGTAIASLPVTVDPLPAAGTISGAANVCVGAAIPLSGTTAGGAWTTTLGNATISSGGLLTGVTAGSETVSYAVTNGCGTDVATKTITIDPLPDAGAIIGPLSVCVSATVSCTNSVSGGVWSTAGGNAAVSGTGSVTGISVGTETISYSLTGACGTAAATKIITIDPLPDAGNIASVDNEVCIGAALACTASMPGGVWSVTNANASISASGIITGLIPGAVTVQYTATNSCGTDVASKDIMVKDCSTTSVAGTQSPEIAVYPNPASDILTINCVGLYSNLNAVMIDVTGKTVVRAYADLKNEMHVDVSGLADGIYTLHITGDNINENRKVIVSRK